MVTDHMCTVARVRRKLLLLGPLALIEGRDRLELQSEGLHYIPAAAATQRELLRLLERDWRAHADATTRTLESKLRTAEPGVWNDLSPSSARCSISLDLLPAMLRPGAAPPPGGDDFEISLRQQGALVRLEASCADDPRARARVSVALATLARTGDAEMSAAARQCMQQQQLWQPAAAAVEEPGWYMLTSGGVRRHFPHMPLMLSDHRTAVAVRPLEAGSGHPAAPAAGRLARGVFARKRIQRGTQVTSYSDGGVWLTKEEAAELAGGSTLADYMVEPLSLPGLCLCGNPLGGAGALGPVVNDIRCTGKPPNAAYTACGLFAADGRLEGVSMGIQTLRDVEAGDELLCIYGEGFWALRGVQMDEDSLGVMADLCQMDDLIRSLLAR